MVSNSNRYIFWPDLAWCDAENWDSEAARTHREYYPTGMFCYTHDPSRGDWFDQAKAIRDWQLPAWATLPPDHYPEAW